MSTLADKTETIYIGCQCHSANHIIRVSYFDWQEKDEPELYFELQADKGHLNFWERLKMAVNFVIGRGDIEWHDVIPTPGDVFKLRDVVENYTDDYAKWQNREIENGRT